MSIGNLIEAEAIAQKRDAFVERLLQSAAGTFDIMSVYIGHSLGFYQALAAGAPLTSTELASRTRTYERYAREWLEQQTVTGILAVEDASVEARSRKFYLPPGHNEVLVEKDSLNYLTPLAQLLVGAVHPMAALLEAYRTGGGVPYSHYGQDFLEGQAAMNRSMFLTQLGSEWLPAIPDVHARLQADPPARIADIGCGAGWSSLGIARAYPKAQVDGFDLDGPSIELARANLRETDLAGRVAFQVRDAGETQFTGRYDLVTAFECVHDMSNPAGVLRAMRNMVKDDGAVLVVDERVSDNFMGNGNEVEWMMYGWSILHCLAVGMADRPSVETGTVMRAETLQKYAQAAGFRRVEVLPIDNFFFRFYRLYR